jgi:UDP-N-acetylglucosamine 2-epimerase (non-hydrolysing)
MTRALDVITVVGTRPNLVKAAALDQAFRRHGGFRHRLLNTGQHYDTDLYLQQWQALNVSSATWNLGVGSSTHSTQTAKMMLGIEDALRSAGPVDALIIPGDVNSGLAGALVGSQMRIPIAHVEAGLRSFERGMPEERNRRVIDCLSDICFVSEEVGVQNLVREGRQASEIHMVGNILADAVESMALDQPGLRGPVQPPAYGLVTLHREGTVDDPAMLVPVLLALEAFAAESGMPLMFPVHPRTRARIGSLGFAGLQCVSPLAYGEFLRLLRGALLVLTDSGGVQVEACLLGTPCVTLRNETEHRATLEFGNNRLAGLEPDSILKCAREALQGHRPPVVRPPRWDGGTGDRIADILWEHFARSERG